MRNINKSTNQTKRRIQNTVKYLWWKLLISAIKHFEKQLHLDNTLLRLSSMRCYLNYWQPRKSVVSRRFFFFFEQQRKGNILENLLFFIEKLEGTMRNPKRRQSTASYILDWRNKQIFHSVTTTFIRQLRESTQLSIQFMWALWSSN